MYICGYGEAILGALRVLRSLGFKGSICTTSAFNASSVLQRAGSLAEGVFFPLASLDVSSQQEPVRTFVARYRKIYNLLPDIYAAHGYDAALAAMYAIRDLTERTGAAVRQRLRALAGMDGVMGPLAFDDYGNIKHALRNHWIHRGRAEDYESYLQRDKERPVPGGADLSAAPAPGEGVLASLYRQRGLVAALVARDLKARYRGTFLGYLWSLLNPLLLLAVYTVVFTFVIPARVPTAVPYPLFLFAGLLPWLFGSGALLDAAVVLPDNGPLLRKVVCAPEVFPAVTVLSHLVHHLLALPVLLVATAVVAWLGVARFPVDGGSSARCAGAVGVCGRRDEPGGRGPRGALPGPQGPAAQPAQPLLLRDPDHLHPGHDPGARR